MNLIIEYFIPADEVERLEKKIEFSEELDDWCVKELETNPLPKQASAYTYKRPLCNFAKMSLSFGDTNPRYKPENILTTDLDLPTRMTEDFSGEPSQKI